MEPRDLGMIQRRKRARARRKRNNHILLAIVGAIALLAVVLLIINLSKGSKHDKGPVTPGESVIEENSKEQKRLQAIAQATYLTQSYDYDGAIAELQTIEEYESDEEVLSQLDEIEQLKASCVPVNLEEVTHIFYHSLVVDEERAFGGQDTNPQAAGNNQWMTTVDEFNAITQEMYDRGYVLVSIHDLYDVTTDENGNEKWVPAEILLPEGKKAFVLSLDDLSYYHAYDNYGYAARLILDANGKVVNEYYNASGEMEIGAYDCVPLLDAFVEEHPDASYRGAKGIIALTGYNGVLGYRTDITYDLNNPDCDIHQQAWIKAHPDFSLENERTEAKKVADAMKANGWEFASHTWGHMRVGDRSLSAIQVDTQKWRENVEPIVGATDTLIFAHGTDISGPGEYSASNEKFQYFKSQGINIFCNVDSNEYSTVLGNNYMRQGRRNIDGYRIYKNAVGEQNNLSDLFDAATILDPDRPPVPEL